MKKIFFSTYAIYVYFTIAGLFLGWLLFHSHEKKNLNQVPLTEQGKKVIWTCAMHPQIRMDKPGKCPICGMDLIPLTQLEAQTDSNAVIFSKDAIELANVETSVVSRRQPEKKVRLYGKVQADERLLQSQVAHISGRIDKLFVNFTGEGIRKGQPLAIVYSPQLVTAQQELLEAAKTKDSQPAIYEAAMEKLGQWKLTSQQIDDIVASGKVKNDFEIVAGTTGVVTDKRVNTGDYVSEGTVLFDVADLSDVWVRFDAYENDLPYLHRGDKVNFTIEALPGQEFTGRIIFIDPVIDPVTRVAGVRVEIGNPAGKLKPEMFATAVVKAGLPEYGNALVIPQSAILWTGKRSIVYLKERNPLEIAFRMREVDLGPEVDNGYIVLKGLQEGDTIVTQGTFSVDAEAQLEGKPSMMNKGDGMNLPAGRNSSMQNMPGMDMSQNNQNNQNTQNIQNTSMKDMNSRTSFEVSGNCEMCQDRIQKAAMSVPGVTKASWNIKSHRLSLAYNGMKTNLVAVHEAIARAGHDNGKYRAPDVTYNSLPACCHYRK